MPTFVYHYNYTHALYPMTPGLFHNLEELDEETGYIQLNLWRFSLNLLWSR